MKFVWAVKQNPLQPRAGDQSYSNGLVRSLVQTGAEGTLVTYGSPEHVAAIPGLKVETVKLAPRSKALSVGSLLPSDAYVHKTRAFADTLVSTLTDDVDVLVVDYFAMGWVLPIVRDALGRRSQPPLIVYVSHNFEQFVRPQVARAAENILKRAVMTLDAAKAVRLERTLVEAASLIVANTDDDRAAYETMSPGKKVVTLTPAYNGTIRPTRPVEACLPRRVVVSGSFDWVAKRMMLKRFVRAAEAPFKEAGIQLMIVGRVPEELVAEIKSISSVTQFTGWVEELGPHIAEARIGVMPDEVGGGFKHKYMDYIFNGVPIATIRSQAQGLPLNLDRDVIARDDLVALIHAVVDMIDDIPALDGMRRRAWDACSETFSWKDRGIRLRHALEDLAGGAPKLARV